MGLFGFGNYDKPGPGVSKDEPPKAAPIRFFELLFRKFSKLVQLNLIFILPTIVACVLMVLIYMAPTHFVVSISGVFEIDGWATFVVPLPLILLSPFVAGLAFVTRNFARDEHAFIWSDFWDAVKGNWKYFLLNGMICYGVFTLLGFAVLYYYSMALSGWMYYIPLWICVVIGMVFLFAQYYLPIMFVTFDLKFTHAYKNALIFTVAGFGRNILVTVILAAMLFAFLNIPLLNITLLVYVLLLILFIFAFISYLISFAVYPVIDKYMIQAAKRAENGETSEPASPVEEEFPGLFSQPGDDDDEADDEDKYVYVNGRLMKSSEIKDQKQDK